jgi:hypothetical protein
MYETQNIIKNTIKIMIMNVTKSIKFFKNGVKFNDLCSNNNIFISHVKCSENNYQQYCFTTTRPAILRKTAANGKNNNNNQIFFSLFFPLLFTMKMSE